MDSLDTPELPDFPELPGLSVADAAVALKVSEKTLRRYIGKGIGEVEGRPFAVQRLRIRGIVQYRIHLDTYEVTPTPPASVPVHDPPPENPSNILDMDTLKATVSPVLERLDTLDRGLKALPTATDFHAWADNIGDAAALRERVVMLEAEVARLRRELAHERERTRWPWQREK